MIVIPVGKTAKVKTIEEFNEFKKCFEAVGKRVGLVVKVVKEDGSQPIGNGMGPALEAKDILKLFKNESDAPQDLKEASIELAGEVFEFLPNVKKGEGSKIAKKILESGKAYEKFKEIIEAQGGLKEIPSAKITYDILATKNGKVINIDNKKISMICRFAGAPKSKASGVFLHKHVGDEVKNGDKLFTIHTDSNVELETTLKYIKNDETIVKVN
jgi:thymidine phosphorylase